jgi:hypothetical protein
MFRFQVEAMEEVEAAMAGVRMVDVSALLCIFVGDKFPCCDRV